MSENFRHEFIEFTLARKVLYFGEYQTKAGRTSPYFFNAGLFFDGQSLKRLAQFYAKAILAAGQRFIGNDKNIDELKAYFNAVIDWVSTVYTDVLPEMRGLEWGRLYKTYHGTSYDPGKISAAVQKLAADNYVTNRKGIFEYLLGGSTDKKLLAVRVFDEKTKRVAYSKQTQVAQVKAISNCPLCAVGANANKSRLYKLDEMDADHVSAWSKGGDSSAKNCQMLCITHNRAKGNR